MTTMNNIPTAEEFLETVKLDTTDDPVYTEKEFINGLIAFAQLHREAILKAATNTMVRELPDEMSVREINKLKLSILNAYPKENIK